MNSMPRIRMASDIVSWAQQPTTNDYATLGTPWQKYGLKTGTVVVKNTGVTNALKYKLLASVDGGDNYDITVKAETVVNATQISVVELTMYYTHVKIEVASNVSGSATTAIARACAM